MHLEMWSKLKGLPLESLGQPGEDRESAHAKNLPFRAPPPPAPMVSWLCTSGHHAPKHKVLNLLSLDSTQNLCEALPVTQEKLLPEPILQRETQQRPLHPGRTRPLESPRHPWVSLDV